jgi:hypothetical protein
MSNYDTLISGQIDRVTGELYATYMLTNNKTHDRMMTVVYQLQCKPTERMFESPLGRYDSPRLQW